ncbi:hypothetical protein OTU49_001751, partial [Cherax quadricarinatus]
TRDVVLAQVDGSLSSLVSAVVRGDLTSITTTCNLSKWKEALVAALTYSNDEQFPALAESLGERLEAKGDPESLLSAMICYVCAGSLEKFVSCWIKTRPETNQPNNLQDLVEIIMGLQQSLSAAGRPTNLSEGNAVSSLLCQYASLLAAQGSLTTAVSYLNSATQGDMVELRDRLYRALGYTTGTSNHPSSQTATRSSNLRRTSTPQNYVQSQDRVWVNYSLACAGDLPMACQKPFYPRILQPTQYTLSVQDQQRSIYGDQSSAQPALLTPSPGFYSPLPVAPPVPQAPAMMNQYGVMPSMGPVQPTPAPPTVPPTGALVSGS